MKSILLALVFLPTILLAQHYDKKWEKVIRFENDGKIKSANAVVDQIYKTAKEEKAEVQVIKCFFYRAKYIKLLEENAQTKILNDLKGEIAMVSVPSRALLNLVYAKCLETYFKENRYKNSNRTTIDSIENKDFLLWTPEYLQKQIADSYLKTLQDESILLKIPLKNYDPVIDFAEGEKPENQNLFEYLLRENIAFNVSLLNSWDEPESFSNYKKQLFGETADFLNLDAGLSKNPITQRIIALYQKLEKMNPSGENRLSRIDFCYTHLLRSQEDYLAALYTINFEAGNITGHQRLLLKKAVTYNESASKASHPDYYVKALQLFDSILSYSNRTAAHAKALNYKQQITSKSLAVQLQQYTYPNENTRAFIEYKNIDNVTISFFKIDKKTLDNIENGIKRDSIFRSVISTKAAQFKAYQLINKKDYFSYTTEVLLPQLEIGNYLVYLESDTNDNTTKLSDYKIITVSNFSMLQHTKKNTDYFTVLDRKTGKPIEDVLLKTNRFTLITDNNGIAFYKKKGKEHSYITIDLTKADDTLSLSYNFFNNESEKKEDTEEDVEFSDVKIEFYLDRAIYRPGQTVYYKGIAVRKKNKKTAVIPNVRFKISILDADDDDFKVFDAVTNEFGSFNGSFVLPKNILTGTFTIEADEPDDSEKDAVYNKKEETHPFWDNVNLEDSGLTFSVEEYKRPKFEVSFENVKESVSVNQLITLKGSAAAFSGSSISDAKVTYTVTRMSNNNWRSAEEKPEVVTTGKTTTDASGKFTLSFAAKPSLNKKKEDLPVFTYQIEATVTDINGETHNVVTEVRAGYHNLDLAAYVPSLIETKNHNNLQLNSTNLNGGFIPVKGDIKLFLLQENTAKFKPRTWQNPEIKSIAEDEFNRLFPYEINNTPIDESKAVLLYSSAVDTEKSKVIALDFISRYKSGRYKIVFSATDSFNNLIAKSAYFNIQQSNSPVAHRLFFTEQLNENPKKDGFILLKITSPIADLYMEITGNYNNEVFFEKNVFLKDHHCELKIPIEKTVTGSIEIGLESTFDNHHYDDEFDINLRTEIPQLKFETEYFRSKIEPGNIENWSFKLIPGNNLSESEVLASMYDSSLDQFASEFWKGPDYFEPEHHSIRKYTVSGFMTSYFRTQSWEPVTKWPLKNEETKLFWFGFDFGSRNNNANLSEYKRFITQKAPKPTDVRKISGIISTLSGPVGYADIKIKGTIRQVQTDFLGYYEIEAGKEEELEITALGCKSKTIKADAVKSDILLETEENALNEVVINNGYRAYRQRASLGAVVTTVENNLVYSAESGFIGNLQGNISGVNVSTGNGKPGSFSTIILRGVSSINGNVEPLFIVDGVPVDEEGFRSINQNDINTISVLKDTAATAIYGNRGGNGVIVITTKTNNNLISEDGEIEALKQIKVRRNLNETAFFFPDLKTDASGKVSFSFTSPESLTEWKFRLLGHNKNAISGYLEKIVLTQKELMLTPNFPRFFREKDTIVINAKIANITNETKDGIAMLQFFDASTMQPVDIPLNNIDNIRNFNIKGIGSTSVSWKVTIPEGLQGIQYKILAKAGDFSDGEENIIPVLTNNILVTESVPVWVRENSKKEYSLENLKNNTSSTLRNHQLTLEYTSNPAWFAIQSLPYLMEYEHECAEQTFARFYANAIASEIIESNPKIATVFESWRSNGRLVSKLEQNEELKSVILAETPWLLDAQGEDEKKKNLALLFDLDKMKNAQEVVFKKLSQKQKSSGGFGWFDGSDENEYITRHIVAGLGHLKKMNLKSFSKTEIVTITDGAIPYLDSKFMEHYKITKSDKNGKLLWHNPYDELHYLYTRSFYLDYYPLSENLKKATVPFINSIKENWLSYSLYEKTLSALTLYRFGEKAAAKKILVALKETSSNNEDWGMYWIENKSGWYWYQAPIETQAILIEAFAEVDNDTKSVDAMKVWLLKNKQNKNWPSTKSTTEAIYALLMQGTDWLSVRDNTVIKVGDEKILTRKLSENEKEAQTGYIKLNWKPEEINNNMAGLSIENKSKVPGFGGFYWQYFEDIDKIKSNPGGNLSVSKELYLKKSTSEGNKLEKITTLNPLKVGDLVTVRLIITVAENVEYIHLKDMRASCFEPVNVLSEYVWKDGLGYYMSTKDIATHFFFDAINKGAYILEYDIRVNNTGNFSNGITNIESMYAPEFTSHTKGIRIIVKD